MKPENEAARLEALESYRILDTEAEAAFDDLTRLAAQIIRVPTALVSLIDSDRQWFKSRVGLELCETPRDVSFCSHAIMNPAEPLIVLDAQEDPRFADNPLVTGTPGIRFYAGVPLVTPNDLALGTLCVIDYEPRELGWDQIEALHVLARNVQSQLELRKTCGTLADLSNDLVRRNDEIRTFYHAVSHELKTPLTSAREFLSIVLDGVAGGLTDEQSDYIGTALNGIDQITYYVNDLLDSTRLETGKMTLNLEAVSARELVESSCRMMMPRTRTKGVKLVNKLPTDDIVLSADPKRIAQVLTNLIGNAIKFTPPKGKITVAMSRDKDPRQVLFSVADNGCGIPDEHQSRVFDRLYQCDDEHERKGGLGLGLNICRGIVELHGGNINVESKLGQGCTFRFTLPAAEKVIEERVLSKNGV